MVAFCISSAFKESAACRSQCEYAQSLSKPVVFVQLEQGYSPDGWLRKVVSGSKCHPLHLGCGACDDSESGKSNGDATSAEEQYTKDTAAIIDAVCWLLLLLVQVCVEAHGCLFLSLSLANTHTDTHTHAHTRTHTHTHTHAHTHTHTHTHILSLFLFDLPFVVEWSGGSLANTASQPWTRYLSIKWMATRLMCVSSSNASPAPTLCVCVSVSVYVCVSVCMLDTVSICATLCSSHVQWDSPCHDCISPHRNVVHAQATHEAETARKPNSGSSKSTVADDTLASMMTLLQSLHAKWVAFCLSLPPSLHLPPTPTRMAHDALCCWPHWLLAHCCIMAVFCLFCTGWTMASRRSQKPFMSECECCVLCCDLHAQPEPGVL